MTDERSTASRIPDPGIRALYKLENRWQAWLDVEAALARAQAGLGIIPEEAAGPITRAAKLSLMDRARIDEGYRRTAHTIVPLVWELSRIVGEPHGGWVHWGATTQNITQTGDLIVLRQAHQKFLGLMHDALLAMADLAERGADRVRVQLEHAAAAAQQQAAVARGRQIADLADHGRRDGRAPRRPPRLGRGRSMARTAPPISP